ncbi:YDG domain-containing protein [Rhodobacter sp. KR11]|uniref:two-partner secretion domain-containing protein n=1 Tax=Rhodobacter sp. KR11 TaxID=2974588 RepID=UPI0022224323|nr:YDG domain-containing protein [Rhodobacter sp. KR11]MCW1920274.1 YDG domain-containing protein [Rhodobacter sp. KR11]
MARNRHLGLSRLAILLLGAAVLPLRAQELPSGGQVVAGDVTMTQGSGRVDVTQTGAFGIVEWDSFGIGAGGVVAFDNGAGATLNRVTGPMPSRLDGTLTATGSVYLVNPQGLVIGPGGRVNTGGRFVGSSLDVADADFLDGGDLTFAGAGGVVVNLGAVGSMGGDVALIAGDVLNAGALAAPGGTVALAAGRQVLLRDQAVEGGLISVLVGGGDVTDRGAITAAAAELRAKGGNVLALAGNTSAVTRATGVEKRAGRIFLTAEGGKVTLAKPVDASDAVTVTGQDIDLSGTVSAPDVTIKAVDETTFTGMIQTPGGFVELSGGHITYDGRIDLGGGTLLIDPHNIEITDRGSAMLSDATVFTTSDIATLLASGDVILDTSTPDTGHAGTILVTSDLIYSSPNDLTLLAMGDIYIVANVQNDSTGAVAAVAGWDGTTAWDRATFAATDLSTTTLFGNATGVSFSFAGYPSPVIASGNIIVASNLIGMDGAAFGSRFGDVSVLGQNVFVMGSMFGFGSADPGFHPHGQIGFHSFGGGDLGTVQNSILVRAVQRIEVRGASGPNSYALIGNGGNEAVGFSVPSTVNLGGDIRVDAGGLLWVHGSEDPADVGAYAMIGHGNRDPFGDIQDGDRSGAITLTAGVLAIEPGVASGAVAAIGHATGGGTITAAPVTVTAGEIEDAIGFGNGVSDIDIRDWADLTHFGDVRLTVTASDLRLLGSTELIDTEGPAITSAGDLIVQTSGALTLDELFFYGNDGTGGLVLAGASVDNQAGSGAFLPIGGGWAIYATRPDQDSQVIGALDPDALVYGVTYAPASPFGPNAALGNLVYYSVTPTILTDDGTMTYGEIIVDTASHVLVAGVEVDAATFGFVVQPEIDYTGLPITADGFNAAGVFADALFSSVAPTGAGQVLGYAQDRGTFTVNRATLQVFLGDQTKTYDGQAYQGSLGYEGFVGTDDDSLITLTYDYAGGDGSGRNAGSYLVSILSALDSSGNYDVVFEGGADLVIDPAALTISLPGTLTKTYDGTRAAVLTASDYLVQGLIAGESLTILQTQGLYDAAGAGERTVSVDLSIPANLAFGGGGAFANYSLPTLALGSGQIDRATLVVSITGTPSKLYDGTTSATLTAANYTVTGLAPGEAVTLTPGPATYAALDPGTQTLTAALTRFSYAPEGATDLANYVLDLEASGPGVILAPAPILAPEEPPVVTPTAEEEPTDPEPPALRGTLELVNTETTGRIMEDIQAGTSFCREFVDAEFAIDCLSDRLQSVADGLSATGEYAEVRAALEDAAANLHALAVQNASEALSRSVGRGDAGQTTARPLTPVDAALLADANAQAAAIIANTQLVLLRSTASSERRRVAFSQVGQVLGTTTVLLRAS